MNANRRDVALGIILWAATASAQALLLPEARHLTGRVVDEAGNPVAGAGVGHTGNRGSGLETDADGRFGVYTRAPLVVIRKPEFRSEAVRTQDAQDVRITLRKAERTFPTCTGMARREGIGFLDLPRIPGVKVGPVRVSDDASTRSYEVKTRNGNKRIRHGSGAMWGFLPFDLDVWRSVRYEEVTFQVGRRIIIDARGQFANGDRWRYLGQFGESATYHDVDEATAKMLDRVLDGACLAGQ